MHVDSATLGGIQETLGCRIEGFPQTYLGLPLSAEKLRLAAFNPLIAKVDKYLSGWRALLMSAGGKLVLLNVVLDALPTFAMGALELPPWRARRPRQAPPRLPLGCHGQDQWRQVPRVLGAGLPAEVRRRIGCALHPHPELLSPDQAPPPPALRHR
jgi:hypothetical protein